MDTSRTPTMPIPAVPVLAAVPLAEPATIPTLVRASEQPPTLLPAPPPRSTWTDLLQAYRVVNRVWNAIVEIVLGVVFMPVSLAILSSLPLLNFIALGYLLEAGGRIARTGRLRDGFIGIRRAGRVGGLLLGISLTLLLVSVFVSWPAQSAALIDPTSSVTRNYNIGLGVATVFAVMHIAMACLWGGKLRHFLLPFLHPVFAILAFVQGNPLTRARDGVWTFWTEARPWYFFWLGLRGAVGALIWLAVPVSLLAVGWRLWPLGFLGFLLLLPVLVILPFLQMQFAATKRFKKMFDVRLVLRLYLRAPWACTFALFITLLFALPLYLLKIKLLPNDAVKFAALVFIAFIWPARLLTGWVCGRAIRRQRASHWFFWITGAIPVPLFVLVYGFFVWLSQYVSWYGVASLYEQHAFLLPVPFTGL